VPLRSGSSKISRDGSFRSARAPWLHPFPGPLRVFADLGFPSAVVEKRASLWEREGSFVFLTFFVFPMDPGRCFGLGGLQFSPQYPPFLFPCNSYPGPVVFGQTGGGFVSPLFVFFFGLGIICRADNHICGRAFSCFSPDVRP